jgi:hypothetical protein
MQTQATHCTQTKRDIGLDYAVRHVMASTAIWKSCWWRVAEWRMHLNDPTQPDQIGMAGVSTTVFAFFALDRILVDLKRIFVDGWSFSVSVIEFQRNCAGQASSTHALLRLSTALDRLKRPGTWS